MYIGKVKLSSQWQKVEDLIKAQVSGQSSFAFVAGKTYQLQSEGNLGVRLCDASTIPQDDRDGEVIEGMKTAQYNKDEGSLYAKVVFSGKLTEEVLLKVSDLGE